jgi:prolyl 3-hydroxylase /prolyl 3,4-dihydroxylase
MSELNNTKSNKKRITRQITTQTKSQPRAQYTQSFLAPAIYDIEKLHKKYSLVKPYPHVVIDDMFDTKKLKLIKHALLNEEFKEKRSDLFSFKQTNDLKYTTNPLLAEFTAFLYGDSFVSFMNQLTGRTLAKKPDIFGSLYQDTDHLLIHDDQLDGRTIAFLLYLEDMTPTQGGSLALYNSKNGNPTKIHTRIIPRFGRFAFFEVSAVSFHEVTEVLAKKNRLALGGWFHDQ